jgi:hypothetical protein
MIIEVSFERMTHAQGPDYKDTWSAETTGEAL